MDKEDYVDYALKLIYDCTRYHLNNLDLPLDIQNFYANSKNFTLCQGNQSIQRRLEDYKN